MGSLYIGAQGCVPVLLENLCSMSCSGTCWPLGGAWFQCRYVEVACQGFLVREACVGVLVGGAVFLLSGVQ